MALRRLVDMIETDDIETMRFVVDRESDIPDEFIRAMFS